MKKMNEKMTLHYCILTFLASFVGGVISSHCLDRDGSYFVRLISTAAITLICLLFFELCFRGIVRLVCRGKSDKEC